jgi:hypothetical protein
VRAARLLDQAAPWWKRLFSPAPLAGLAAATAALVFSLVTWSGHDAPAPPDVALDTDQAAAIQEIAETELLIAAADNLDDFSDTELVTLIGF